MAGVPERADGISSVMQSIGRRYVQYINYERPLYTTAIIVPTNYGVLNEH